MSLFNKVIIIHKGTEACEEKEDRAISLYQVKPLFGSVYVVQTEAALAAYLHTKDCFILLERGQGIQRVSLVVLNIVKHY